jgi:hypothetical protein
MSQVKQIDFGAYADRVSTSSSGIPGNPELYLMTRPSSLLRASWAA